MINLDDLFDKKAGFDHVEILVGASWPWEPITNISAYISNWLTQKEKEIAVLNAIDWGELQETIDEDDNLDRILYVQKIVRLKEDIFLKKYGIYIGAGTLLEPSAIIKPSVIIGKNCEIRQGAYIRGNVITGDSVVIGHNTEIKNSIIMNHSEAGHFSYIGDCIIGNYVNMGAGTKLANLQFRTIREKKTGVIRTINLRYKEQIIDTGLSKLGAIIGDEGELGCNSVTSPCVIFGRQTRVYPNVSVNKGYYAPGSVIAKNSS